MKLVCCSTLCHPIRISRSTSTLGEAKKIVLKQLLQEQALPSQFQRLCEETTSCANYCQPRILKKAATAYRAKLSPALPDLLCLDKEYFGLLRRWRKKRMKSLKRRKSKNGLKTLKVDLNDSENVNCYATNAMIYISDYCTLIG